MIVLASLWYTNVLVNKISREERNKITLWAEAIHKKNRLVNYTIELLDKLGQEEEKMVSLVAKATNYLATANDIDDYTFIVEVVQFNTTVPVITTDQEGNVKSYRNLERDYDINNPDDLAILEARLEKMKLINEPIEVAYGHNVMDYLYFDKSTLTVDLEVMMGDLVQSFMDEVVNSASVPVLITDSTKTEVLQVGGQVDTAQLKVPGYMESLIAEMGLENEPIALKIGNNVTQYIFYKDSKLLTQLRYYPYFQFGIIGLFLIIAYYLFSTSRKGEQNRVWVGMAKETAHQLGTPLSSLIAWLEYLKTKDIEGNTLDEIGKDVNRLEKITERFSKIGSEPKLEPNDLMICVRDVVNYLKARLSDNVKFEVKSESDEVMALFNGPLFEWVLENIIKNAVDSMEGRGNITLVVGSNGKRATIDIIDTGKGVRKSNWKTVFQPGYTTKKRGWGLGLSLVKRIVENYHSGKVFIKASEANVGTTFRIILKR